MASGRETSSARPSTCTHSPYQLSSNARSDARGSRRRFLVLNAVSRLLISARPPSSRPTAMGDICGRPSDRNVANTPRWCSRRYARASSRSMQQSLPGMGYNSAMIPIVPPEIERYAELHTTPLPEHLRALAAETEKSMQFAQMMVGQLEGRFLEMLVFMTGARRVLEIGMFTGYSALSMASACH